MNRQTTTLCIIARDEEACIGQAIKSALAVVDEIVVADTGSADNTRLIAEGYGARVIDVPWRDDFAAARNAALEDARCDWVLVLDADERLQPVRPVAFQKLLAADTVAGYRLNIENQGGEEGRQRPTCGVRLFRNHPHVRYCYPVHERISVALENWASPRNLSIVESGLVVVHERPDSEGVRRSRERNRRLLEDAVREYPWEPYFAYRLAEESMVFLDDDALPLAGLNAALGPLAKAWKTLADDSGDTVSRLEYGAELAARLCAGYLALDRGEEARAVADKAREIYPDSDTIRFQWALTALRSLPDSGTRGSSPADSTALAETVASIFRDALHAAETGTDAKAQDDRRILTATCHLGELALWRRNVSEARALFERVLAADRASSAALLGLGRCALAYGDNRRALGMFLRSVTANEMNHAAWLRGSEVLADLGFHDNAASWRRKASILFPELPGDGAEMEPAVAATPSEAPAPV